MSDEEQVQVRDTTPKRAFPLPKDVGDCYLLIGYPCSGSATLALAETRADRKRPGRWKWTLHADDGDIYDCDSVEEFYDGCWAERCVLVRRVREGLDEYLRRSAPPELLPQLLSEKRQPVKLVREGDDLVLPIPEDLVRAYGLEDVDEVELELQAETGRILLRAPRKPAAQEPAE